MGFKLMVTEAVALPAVAVRLACTWQPIATTVTENTPSTAAPQLKPALSAFAPSELSNRQFLILQQAPHDHRLQLI